MGWGRPRGKGGNGSSCYSRREGSELGSPRGQSFCISDVSAKMENLGFLWDLGRVYVFRILLLLMG